MKIVVFPGVCANNIKVAYKYFLSKITKGLNCQGEIFIWEQSHGHPSINNLPLKDTREFVCEVILDFQHVVVHALETKVPEADIYIGHSAGSILALVQNKPCITFASPAALVELTQDKESDAIRDFNSVMKSNTNPVLNIINKYDVIAYPIDGVNVENYEYTGGKYFPLTYFPVTAHTDYWKSHKVINKIIKTIKVWQNI